MELAEAIRVVLATMRRRPADLFPFYMLSLAIPAIVRVMGFAGLAALGVYLVRSGRFATFREELAAHPDPPDPEADPVAFVEWSEGLVPIVEQLVTPTSIVIVLLTGAISLLLLFLLTAAFTGGQLAACFARLRGERGLIAGIRGVRRFWRRMVGIYLLELFLWVLITVAAATVITIVGALSVALAIFVGIFVGLLWLAAAIGIRALFVFVPIAVVVDDQSIGSGIRASAEFIRTQFATAVTYYAIAVGIVLGWATASATLAGFGAPSLAALVSILVIAPFLDLLKVVLFGSYQAALDVPAAPRLEARTQLGRGTKRALRETAAFVRDAPGAHALSVALMTGGFVGGWAAAGPLLGDVQTSITNRTAILFPPTAAVEFFGNNWSVAITTALSGVAAGIPAAVSLLFNGFVFAIYARLEEAPLELLAFVLPHGVIEIPAILIAGALGLSLGLTTWRTWRGRSDRATLASAFERSFWVLIGIGLLLALAGVIEGFVSPYYYRLFL